jgi:succinate-acetate transporter protein
MLYKEYEDVSAQLTLLLYPVACPTCSVRLIMKGGTFMAHFAAERIEAAAKPAEAAAPAVANPGPLGLCAFSVTTFVLSSINAGWFPAASTSIIVGLALFYGGLAQLLAGMWEFKAGNTFGATAFTSYGAFWLALGVTVAPGSGILAAIPPVDVPAALGLFLLAWTIFTGVMFLGSLKTTMALTVVFGLLFLTFACLTLGELGGGPLFHWFGGYLGVATAIMGFYTAVATMKTPFRLPVGPMS